MKFFSICLFQLVLLALPVLLVCPVSALPYRPSTPLLVATETLHEQGVIRRYRIERDANTSTVFFPAKSGGDSPISLLSFNGDGTINVQKNPTSAALPVENSLFLLGGFPLPLDIVPVNQQQQSQEYRYLKKSGGRTFLMNCIVTKEIISPEDVAEKGWIKIDLAADTILWLLSVTTEQGKILSLQLWPEDGNWWLYEQTAFRRSWLIE